ncbi:hypothetical protein TraAM80_01353 [Trypanosoma rangeli]|uniref:Uncharacterized protein n=1 Tax=Trypanosoma rangeli TaxID=5698 RepID=A0A3R7KW02_TRYRA|nr:uncharacterized protein TraAM80_01353 [Trypanosoma rangeli]RNF10811.1 hypothetical protein TraAM80_01353 [Trypanosoma rangeli]|eukprot:RNF10811.1 hypothetical protein TraAM80_01353 [Trypanosoma rangeli]
MTQKLLLAEGLDLLRRTEAREYEVDRSQARICSSNKYRHELSRLVQAYGTVYQDYLRGVEIINYVRRTALSKNDPKEEKLIEMCEGKMRAYMDRCELVRRKEDNILLPLDQMNQNLMSGEFVLGSPLFVLSGAQFSIKHSAPFLREEKLSDGSYLFVVKNLDAYSVAAPELGVTIDIVPQRGQQQRLEKVIPCQCGWRRVIGVVASATVNVLVRSKGLLRDSHVDVALYRLEPKSVTPAEMQPPGLISDQLIAQLPKLTDEELAALVIPSIPTDALAPKAHQGANSSNAGNAMEQLQSLSVPYSQPSMPFSTMVPEPIEVNPANMTCAARLQRLRNTLNAWPNSNVMATSLGRESQVVVQTISALPFPTELSDH